MLQEIQRKHKTKKLIRVYTSDISWIRFRDQSPTERHLLEKRLCQLTMLFLNASIICNEKILWTDKVKVCHCIDKSPSTRKNCHQFEHGNSSILSRIYNIDQHHFHGIQKANWSCNVKCTRLFRLLGKINLVLL